MKASKRNPFDDHYNGEYRLAHELSPKEIKKVLDFGCGNGYFISKFRGKAKEIFACDTDVNRLEKARRDYPLIKFIQVTPGQKLPFSSSFFDLVFALSVLEHVKSPTFVLRELARVLKKGGQIIICVPHRGLMTLFDAGNLKFYFPTLHKLLYGLVFGKRKYQQEFIDKKKIGMFGDFTFYPGMWHRHFRQQELEVLLSDSGFYPKEVVGFSFFLPILYTFQNLFRFLFRNQSRILHKIIKWDSSLRLGRFSDGMVVLAEKR